MMARMEQTTINNLFLHPSSGTEDDSFVGLKIKGNAIEFFYPKAYHFDYDPKFIKNEIVAILKTISLAKTKERNQVDVFTERDSDTDFALDSYLWVIRDFLANGYYINREKAFKHNQKGKINWKRTLNNNPIVSKSGQIIYNDVVVETKNNIDNLLVEIHRHCIKKSIDYIGWIFNINSNFIQTKPFNDDVKRQYISALSTELAHTFEDAKKVRLTHMKNVIQGLDAKLEGKDFVYGVDTYDYVFEKMIDYIFSNEDVTSFYPKGQWYLVKNAFKPINSSDLRPDTILSNGEDVYILDSKFYRFGITGNDKHLPETTSIQKQIVYGDFINAHLSAKYKRVYNAFLIPFDRLDNPFNSNADLFYVGYARTDSNLAKKSYESVHTFLIDLKHVINCWNNGNHQSDRDTLINEIQKVLV